MQDYINVQPRRNQTFTDYYKKKKLYKICNDDQDNDEYLAVKYILDFLPTISYDVCNVMFIKEQKR